MAGRSSRPFRVQPWVQACITVPGGCAALSCSAIAWCRLGSNCWPVGSSRLMPLRSSSGEEAALDAGEPVAQAADDLRLAVGGGRDGCRGRAAGSPPPRPRRWRISAPRIAAFRRPRGGCGRARWRSPPRRASSGPSSRRARPPARRCGPRRPASPARGSPGRLRRGRDRSGSFRVRCSWPDQLGRSGARNKGGPLQTIGCVNEPLAVGWVRPAGPSARAGWPLGAAPGRW